MYFLQGNVLVAWFGRVWAPLGHVAITHCHALPPWPLYPVRRDFLLGGSDESVTGHGPQGRVGGLLKTIR
jgi:hypothetical protein